MKQFTSCAKVHLVILFFLAISCREDSSLKPSTFVYTQPMYGNIHLIPQADSLHFQLEEHIYNSIGSFNYFKHLDSPFISFYDRSSKILDFYNFRSQELVCKIPLKKWFIGEKFKKASTYVINFDSIIIITDKRIFLVDSSSTIKKSLDLFTESEAKAICDNETPGTIINNKFYTGVQAAVEQTSLKAHRQWKVLCGFDLQFNTKQLQYNLPDIYKRNLYGYSFLQYSYCLNNKGNFVFSFPADTNVYETNLTDYHNAYYGKSKFQQEPILPITKEAIENHESFKEYSIRDSYGSIYFDNYYKRYLRVAKQKINESDFQAKNREREKSLLIFNEHFKIIGESKLNDDFVSKQIFFTPDGKIYARVKPSDEQAIHFVRLSYSDIITNQSLSKR